MKLKINKGIANAKDINTRVTKTLAQEKGITLISLVITIIILLILGGVAISIAVDSDGLFARARKAAEDWNTSVTDEQTAISNILGQLDDLEMFPQNVPNPPELLTGMTPVKFTLPEGDTAGTMVETNKDDPDWYNYEEKMWANAKTEDGSLWVWIPRYAYKLNPSTQTADVVFLQGITDNYYDAVGDVVQAKRCTGKTDVIDTTTGFTVHPAFTDESDIDYRNGGWDKELSGIWVAKFEAGYAGSGSSENKAEVKPSSVNYKPTTVLARAVERGESTEGSVTARNWLDGIYGATETAIKYPTFQPLAYSMNYISHSDAFDLCRAMEESGNIYGFVDSNADTHMMKDSEWGSVSYLSKSAYGLGSTDIYINNVTLDSNREKREDTAKDGKTNVASAYAVTGVTEGGADSEGKQITKDKYTELIEEATNNTATATDKIYKWNQIEGQKASSTGNMYGIYDLSGGLWERTSSYVDNGNGNVTNVNTGKSISDAVADDATKKYVLKYTKGEKGTEATEDEAAKLNYIVNSHIYGNAMNETSTAGTGISSWHDGYSNFVRLDALFSVRGGHWSCHHNAGLFCFAHNNGCATCYDGFRAVAVAE